MPQMHPLNFLEQGDRLGWNNWRKQNPEFVPDLREMDLRGRDLKDWDFSNGVLNDADLRDADLRGANLTRAYLAGAILAKANFRDAILTSAHLEWAILKNTDFTNAALQKAQFDFAYLFGTIFLDSQLQKATLASLNLAGVSFRKAKLNNANLKNSDLTGADLTDADLSGATLTGARICETIIKNATLSGAKVYNASVWSIKDSPLEQRHLLVTKPRQEPRITADNIELAQYIFLLLDNERIRGAIDALTSKVVLILGRFTEERKKVLDAIRNKIRELDYVSVLFDFERPASQSIIETVLTLAHISRFVIADFTEARMVLDEVPRIAKAIALPIKPLFLKESGEEPEVLRELRRDHVMVLETFYYSNEKHLFESLKEQVIDPAERMRHVREE